MMWNLQKCFLASRRTNTDQNFNEGMVIIHLDNMMSGMQFLPAAMSEDERSGFLSFCLLTDVC